MKVYVVEMVKGNDGIIGSPHYILGVYDNEEEADYVGAAETGRRAYMYACRIIECTLNEPAK